MVHPTCSDCRRNSYENISMLLAAYAGGSARLSRPPAPTDSEAGDGLHYAPDRERGQAPARRRVGRSSGAGRGRAAGTKDGPSSGGEKVPTVEEIGLTRKQVHEARVT